MKSRSSEIDLVRRDIVFGGTVAGVMSGLFTPLAAAFAFSSGIRSQSGGCQICGALADYPRVSRSDAVLTQRVLRSPLVASAAARGQQNGAQARDASGSPVVLRPDWVLATENETLKLLHGHEVVVIGDTIVEIRPHSSVTKDVVRMSGQVVTPSFISGHTHSCAGTLTRGYIEQTSLGSIQGEGGAPRARSLLIPMTMIDDLSDEELDDLTAINLAEMVRTGCTTQVEMSLSQKQMRSYVRVASKFGMRGYPGGMVPSMDRLLAIWTRSDDRILLESEKATLAEIAANLEYARAVNGSSNGRIRPMMAPSVVVVHTGDTFAAIQRAADELGNGIHIHVQNQWRPRDRRLLQSFWGENEVEVMQEVGLLDRTLFAAHLLGLELEKDLPILARAKRFTFAHCPSAAGASVLPSSQPYPEALAAGVNTSIGLDTHSNDYLENIKLAVMQGRARAQLLAQTSPVPLVEPTIWNALESATLGAARGLGRDDLGRIQLGAKADLCSIAIDSLLIGSGTPAFEPLNNLLYANGLAVRHVMTDGKWQVRDGQLLVGNEVDLIARGGAAVNKIWMRLRDQGYFDSQKTR